LYQGKVEIVGFNGEAYVGSILSNGVYYIDKVNTKKLNKKQTLYFKNDACLFTDEK
jgi:hypothetical protein